jgi:lipoprotein-releasing system permease protein
MQRKFESFMALRYLRGAQGTSKGTRFLRFITYVAIGGVALGVAALILALSIVRGFKSEIESKIIGFGAQIQVESFRDAPLENASSLYGKLSAQDGVERISSVVQEFILLRKSRREIDGVSLWGTDELPRFVTGSLLSGTGFRESPTRDLQQMVIGASLARKMGMAVGDRVTAFSVRKREGESILPAQPRVKQFRIVGIFESSLANFDDLYVFTSLDPARDLLNYGPEQVTRFDLYVRPGWSVKKVSEAADDMLEFPVMSRTIYEVYRNLFAWVALQQSIIPLVISVIVLVAAFNIVGTLLMVILEKTRDIGILAGMGADPASLRKLFLRLGIQLGVVAVAVGEVIALVLALLQLEYGIIPLPKEAYYMSTAPIELSGSDFLIVAVFTIALCAISAYIPARYAARIDPIRAIHTG